MKIAEVRNILEKYSEIQLKFIITEMYKAIPKRIKEDKDFDSLIKQPDMAKETCKKRRKNIPLPDIDDLKFDTDLFIEYARKQYYFIPNSFVSKRERPKWRFIVKRLVKNLTLAASDRENLPEASELLEQLYVLICYSCDYILFSGYDSFQSVGIEQKDFFHRVLALKFQHEKKPEFIKNAILLMNNHSLNRYTLYTDSMDVILEFLKTPDLKEMAIAHCKELIKQLKSGRIKIHDDYKKDRKIQNLATMVFKCFVYLHDYESAIDYFKKNYRERDKEIALYIMLGWLFHYNQKDYWVKEYESAVENGIIPRDRLTKMYQFINENGKLPDYIY